jgi:hypothetical protein
VVRFGHRFFSKLSLGLLPLAGQTGSDTKCGVVAHTDDSDTSRSPGEVSHQASTKNVKHGSVSWQDWRQEVLIVIAVLTAVTCLFYFEIVFMGRTILPLQVEAVMGSQGPYGYDKPFRSDLYSLDRVNSSWHFEPLTRKVREEFRSGRFPLWNDNQAFGMPLLADPQSGGLDLLRLPLYLNFSALGWDFYYLTRSILGALATYLFARCVGLAVPARFFFAIAYVFSGHFLLLGNNHWIEAYFLLPVILLGTELTLGNRPRLGFAVTAVAVALNLFVGMPEVSLGVFLLSAAYGAYRLLGRARQLDDIRDPAARSALLAGAWLVGMALAAPLLLPFFEFVTHSAHASTGALRSGRETFGAEHAPLADFAFWFMPYLNGPLVPLKKPIYFTTYAGATVLALAIYGLSLTQTELYRRLVPIAAVAAALYFAKSFGVPGITELGRLPALNVTRIPFYFGPVAGFCLALLASVGVHELTCGRRRPVHAAAALAAVCVFVLLGVYANWDTITQDWGNHVYVSIGIAVLFAIAVWLTIQFLPIRPEALRGVACCVLLVGELFLLAPHGIYQDRYERFVEAPYITFLKEKQGTSAFRIFGADAMLVPNSASVFGLHDIRAYTPLFVDRFRTYIQQFISPNVVQHFLGFPLSDKPDAETAASVLKNPWFDLTGVRYVIVRPGSRMADLLANVIVDRILASDAQMGHSHIDARVVPVTIGGRTKRALFEHPPDSVQFKMKVEPESSVLHFALGLQPEVWDPSFGDGVGFELVVEAGGKAESVYRRDIDPKNDPSQRRWIDDSVDLSRFMGQTVVLHFVTHSLESPSSDWAVWGDLRLASVDEESQQYRIAYNDEVQIFENQHALPRAFLVQDVLAVDHVNDALSAMKRTTIDPRHVAIVEGAPEYAVGALGPGDGTAAIAAYHAQYAAIDVDAESPSLLVLTDTMYPGWIAKIDGQEAPIYATDIAFRGVFVPAGQHRVEFSYDPLSFRIGMAIAMLGVLVLAAVVAGLDPRPWLHQSKPRRL